MTIGTALANAYYTPDKKMAWLSVLSTDPYEHANILQDDVPSGGVSKLPLVSTQESLMRLASLPENWDGAGSAKPNTEAVLRAISLLEVFYPQAMATRKPWYRPHVSASEGGEVVLEWWKGARKLTIYVGAVDAEYIRVWGSNMSTEMDDGELDGAQFQELWLWLNA